MTTAEITQLVSPVLTFLLMVLGWYYRKDMEANQKIIASLNSGMEELKGMMRVQATNYQHLLEEVREMAGDIRDNTGEINRVERQASEKIHAIQLELERIRKQ